MQIFIVRFHLFFSYNRKKDNSILFLVLTRFIFFFRYFFFFFLSSMNLGTILNPLHTKPAELLFHFSCLSSFHLAAVELGRNHARLFGLAVNSAITHAKTENLTFVISLLLRPICSRQTRREARVEEKEKLVCLFVFFLFTATPTSTFFVFVFFFLHKHTPR